MRGIFERLKRRTPNNSKSGKPVARDWSTDWTSRDWADLPTHHPRNDADAS